MDSFLQTKQWADFRQSYGWIAHNIEGVWFLQKNLPLGKNFLYAPEVNFNALKNLDNILKNIEIISQKNNTIFTRLEILDEYDQLIVDKFKNKRFIKAFEEVQPEWRQVIDITKSDEEILAQMKQKGRYNIKVAQKHNIVIEKSQNIDDYYQIFIETSKRDGFEIRPRQYFDKLFEIFDKNICQLFVAKYHGQTLATAIIIFYNQTASYLYGASSNDHREVMAPYLLHWEIMKCSKEMGCNKYDLLAIEPFSQPQTAKGLKENNINNNQAESGKLIAGHHKYAGITRFKEQFGGRKVHLVGSWDLVYKSTWYKMFKIAEKWRRR